MLQDFLIQLRSMYFYSHHCHNVCKGSTFFQDHEFFGDAYSQLLTDYDDVAERIVHMGGENLIGPMELLKGIEMTLSDAPFDSKDNKLFFAYLYKQEKKLGQMADSICKNSNSSEGLKQLIGDIANKSEKRCYFSGQRMK